MLTQRAQRRIKKNEKRKFCRLSGLGDGRQKREMKIVNSDLKRARAQEGAGEYFFYVLCSYNLCFWWLGVRRILWFCITNVLNILKNML